MAGEQFAGDDAEGIEVAGGGDGEAADLLGAGVVGGEGVEPALGGGELLGPLALAEEAGDAEVEEFDGAVGGDEDVAGLEVAVDDEVLVGVLDGGRDLAQEREARAQGEAVGGGVGGDGDAVDVLHDEVRLAVGGDAAVEQGGDVPVVEVGEDLAFVAEAADGEVALVAAAEELEGDAFLELVVGADPLVDGPHAADADEAGEGVGADAGADGGGGGIAGGEGIGEDGAVGALPGGVPAVEGGEQAFDFGAQRGVGPAGPVQVVPALGHRALQRCIEQLPNSRQPLGSHRIVRRHFILVRANAWRRRFGAVCP